MTLKIIKFDLYLRFLIQNLDNAKNLEECENFGDLQLTKPPFSSTTTPSSYKPFEEALQTALLEPPITVSFNENQSSKSLDETTFDSSGIFN